jgi:pimeloyl-ACP methyl ester carboxylesterase
VGGKLGIDEMDTAVSRIAKAREMKGKDARGRRSPLSRRVAVGAAGAGLAAAALFNWRRSTDSERRNPPVGQFLNIDGMKLHYIDRGAGTPIVLLHGNGAMVGDWEASGVIDGLMERHRVIAIDRPGFGHTVRTRTRIWSPAAQAALFAKAMRELGVHDAVVVGHSWGVLPALALALDHPELVSSLVLMSGVYYPELRSDIITSLPSSLPGIGDVLCHTVTPLMAAATAPMQTKTIFEPAPVPDAFQDFPMGMSLRPSQMRTQVKETVMLPVVTAALARRYAELTLPVTIVTGAEDKIASPETQSERLHQAIQGSKYVKLAGVGHMANYTALEEVLAAIEDAASRSQPAKAS